MDGTPGTVPTPIATAFKDHWAIQKVTSLSGVADTGRCVCGDWEDCGAERGSGEEGFWVGWE